MPNLFPQGVRGLADSKFAGVLGSVYRMVGIDIHSEPGLIKVHQKLTKDSGSTVDALCRVRIAASDGSTLWFSYTTGKIWRRTSAGAWSLVHTTTPAVGGAGCLGAEEHDGYIYWATESRLHRKTITDLSNWLGGVTQDWGTFTNTDSEFHPMVKQGTSLFIGDANYVAKVSGDTGSHAFTANALDLRQPFRIKTMIKFDIDILIGTFINANVNYCEVLRWDTEAESWISSDALEENGINCFVKDDNYVYVNVGRCGRLYFYDGRRLIPYKRIPGSWDPNKTAEIYPQATTTLLTIPLFGLSNIAGNPQLQGVYSFGSYSKDYPKVLGLSFVISSGATSGVEIGAIQAIGADLLVSWYDGTNYGVDKLDYQNKYASAYIETTSITSGEERNFLKSTLEFFANYAKLPTGTDITFKYKKQHEVDYNDDPTSLTDTKLMQVRAEATTPEVAALQMKIELTVQNDNQAFTAATSDVITSAAHGLANGDIVTVASSTTLPAGLSANTEYYVVEKTTDTFKLSATPGGTAIDITDTGTGTHTWYRNEAPEVEDVGYKDNLQQ